jgi:YHS domain-containing protein
MTNLDDLERRIKERLAVSEERRRLEHDRVQQQMSELEARCRRYTMVADRLIQDVIRPRLDRMAQCFENASVPADRLSRHTAVVEFAHTLRFPATANLEFGITRDFEAKTLVIEYKLQILPSYISFQGEDRLLVPVDGVTDEEVAAWVETKLLAAVDTCLQLETADHYQAANQVIDPVCGMQFHKAQAAAAAEHHGLTYYFCLPACRDKFLADPEQYLARGGC